MIKKIYLLTIYINVKNYFSLLKSGAMLLAVPIKGKFREIFNNKNFRHFLLDCKKKK